MLLMFYRNLNFSCGVMDAAVPYAAGNAVVAVDAASGAIAWRRTVLEGGFPAHWLTMCSYSTPFGTSRQRRSSVITTLCGMPCARTLCSFLLRLTTMKKKEEKVTWSSLPHKSQLAILTLARLSEPLVQTSLRVSAETCYSTVSRDHILTSDSLTCSINCDHLIEVFQLQPLLL